MHDKLKSYVAKLLMHAAQLTKLYKIICNSYSTVLSQKMLPLFIIFDLYTPPCMGINLTLKFKGTIAGSYGVKFLAIEISISYNADLT